MGRAIKGNWRGKPYYDWRMTYKGVPLRVRCEELGLHEIHWTKEASYKAAKNWFEYRIAELTKPDPRTAALAQHELANLEDDYRESQRKTEAKKLLWLAKMTEVAPLEADNPDLLATDGEGGFIRSQADRERLNPTETILEASAVVADKPVEKDRTISRQIERYLALELARGKAANTYADIAFLLRKALNCPSFQENMSIDKISAQTLTDIYAWLKNDSKLAANSQQRIFAYVRRFVRFLWGEHLIELPRNLDARIFSFDRQAAIKTYPTQDVRALLDGLRDRLKMYALLALNCGMYSADMGNLKQTEWQGAYIVRKRTKTKKRENVPTVQYRLWDETRALLERFRSSHSEYVLISERGQPLWRIWTDGGKLREANLIACHWGKQDIPLSALRSVSATLLESHRDYGRCTTLFLGHSPKSIKDRRYAAPPQQLFDEALLWLRQQFFGG